uniref:ING domain-containing protein n=1 Tax=Globodera pallida TaxID=36090 RepID=A0A183CI07_GLOPA
MHQQDLAKFRYLKHNANEAKCSNFLKLPAVLRLFLSTTGLSSTTDLLNDLNGYNEKIRAITSTFESSFESIDEAAKRRRVQQQLESLERDNFQEDPHVNLTWHKAAPKFDDEMVFGDKDIKKRKRKVGSPSKISGAEQARKENCGSFDEDALQKDFFPTFGGGQTKACQPGISIANVFGGGIFYKQNAAEEVLCCLWSFCGLHMRSVFCQILFHSLQGHTFGHSVFKMDRLRALRIWRFMNQCSS